MTDFRITIVNRHNLKAIPSDTWSSGVYEWAAFVCVVDIDAYVDEYGVVLEAENRTTYHASLGADTREEARERAYQAARLYDSREFHKEEFVISSDRLILPEPPPAKKRRWRDG